MRGRPNRVQLERVDVTRDQLDFVRDRVRPLVAQHLDRPLLDLLADAYCQGLTDAAEATTASASGDEAKRSEPKSISGEGGR